MVISIQLNSPENASLSVSKNIFPEFPLHPQTSLPNVEKKLGIAIMLWIFFRWIVLCYQNGIYPIWLVLHIVNIATISLSKLLKWKHISYSSLLSFYMSFSNLIKNQRFKLGITGRERFYFCHFSESSKVFFCATNTIMVCPPTTSIKQKLKKKLTCSTAISFERKSMNYLFIIAQTKKIQKRMYIFNMSSMAFYMPTAAPCTL